MKKKVNTWALAVMAAGVFFLSMMPLPAVAESEESFQEDDLDLQVKANNVFALELYLSLAQKSDGNLVFSPFSVSTAMAMAYAGARGSTQQEMAKALHFELPDQKFHLNMRWLLENINSRGSGDSFQLFLANRLWGQKGEKFLPEYLELVSANYGAALETVDFQNPQQACNIINGWVRENTRDKIPKIIDESQVDPSTALIITNAIYFKGQWSQPFKKEDTREEDFKVTPQKTAKVQMMTQEKEFQYREETDLEVLELPYLGNSVSMVILLPKKVDGLASLEKQLTGKNLAYWLSRLSGHKVTVYLPRFKVEYGANLNNHLKALGMPGAFVPGQADFSGINGAKDLFIQYVLHKAFIEVNEEGSEAGAATIVGVKRNGDEHKKIVFRADHPFIYLIRDREVGSILFMGRVVDPSK